LSRIAASQKTGIEMPVTATIVSTRSSRPPARTAER
jgi:hypothetical protein